MNSSFAPFGPRRRYSLMIKADPAVLPVLTNRNTEPAAMMESNNILIGVELRRLGTNTRWANTVRVERIGFSLLIRFVSGDGFNSSENLFGLWASGRRN